MPAAEALEREALQRFAREAGWDESDYGAEKSEIDSKFEYWLPRVLAYSCVSLLQALVETQLLALANRLRDLHGTKIAPDDLSGSPVERSRTYLTKIMDLDVGSDPAWEHLRNLAKIRNIVIHRRGAIGTAQQHREEVHRLIAKYPDRLSEHLGDLRISFELCYFFLDEVEGFFKRLFLEVGLPDTVVIEQ